MLFNDDDELFRQVCEEMGIELEMQEGESKIDKINASEYFKTHRIFDDSRCDADEKMDIMSYNIHNIIWNLDDNAPFAA